MTRSGWLAIGAIAAALLGASLPPLPAWLIVAAILAGAATFSTLAALAAAYPRIGGRLAPARGAGIPVFVGAIAIALRLALGSAAAAPAPGQVPDGSGPWPATVEAVGAPRDGRQLATLLLDVASRPRVAATLPRFPSIAPGDRIIVSGSTRPPPNDDYGSYLARIGAVATLRATTLELEPTQGGAGRWLEVLRRASAEGIARVLPEPEAGLAAGILVGLRDRVDRDLAAAFTTAGVSHVVAISGWNIAIVAASVAALLRRRPRRVRAWATIIAIVGYTAFAGASPSVVRAAAMAGVVLLARESGRAGRAAGALGWAVTLLLVAEPRLVSDPGFQLSALATAGLVAWATPLTRRLERLGGGRAPGWLTEGLGVSLAAQTATLPIVLLVFGRLALVSPAVNLLVVPLVPPAMAAGALALGAGLLALMGLPGPIAAILGLPAWLVLTVMVRIVEAAAGLPLASVTLEPPASSVAAIACVLVAAPVVGRRRLAGLMAGGGLGFLRLFGSLRQLGLLRQPGSPLPRARPAPGTPRRAVRIAAGVLAASIIGLTLAAASRADGVARVTVLDVGQGDAILVQSGDGGRLLVDGGPDPDRLLVALDGKLPPWDRRIDLLVLTHPHEDHAAGLPLLLSRYRVGRVFEPGMRGPGPGYKAFAGELARTGRRVERLATGDHLRLGEIRLRVLWPDAGSVPQRPPDTGTGINNVSIVLLGDVEGKRFLLTGDIEEEIDPVLLARGLPRIDVLKVAHHGSRTSSTNAFLEAVRPSVAIISAGAGNPYGHPSRATIGRLAAHGARVWRTDLNGSTEVAFAGARLEVRPEAETAPEAAAVLGTLASATTTRTAFTCGISPSVATGLGRDPQYGARPAAGPAVPTSARSTLLYHRADVRARANRSRRPAPEPRSPDLAAAALACGGGGRGLARRPHRARRDPTRSAPRGSRGAPARRRQADPGRRPGGRAPPWRGIGLVARATGAPGAWTGGRGPPRDAVARG